MDRKKGIVTGIIILSIFLGGILLINANNEMTIGANFIGYDAEVVQVSVPETITFGSITPEEPFDETNSIRVNNTGRSAIIVTPQLSSGANEVFNYLSFRNQKTQNGTAVPFTRMGNYTIHLDYHDDETFYMSLNLTEYSGKLSSGNLNLTATVVFTAMAA